MWTLDYLICKVSSTVLGCILADLVYRLILWIKEFSVKKKWESTFKTISSLWSSIFFNLAQFLQIVFLTLGFGILMYLSQNTYSHLVQTVIVGVIWLVLRVLGIIQYDLLNDEETILLENNAVSGRVLAYNYYDGLLRYILKENIEQKIGEYGAGLEVTLSQHGWHGSLRDWGFEIYPHLIILLPESCQLDLRDANVLRRENVHKVREFEPNISGDDSVDQVGFNCDSTVGKKTCSVMWIYKNEEDDEFHHCSIDRRQRAEKILFTFDLPTILKNSLKPQYGWSQEAVTRQVQYFEDYIRKLLVDQREFGRQVVFCRVPLEVNGDQNRPPLAHYLREVLNSHSYLA